MEDINKYKIAKARKKVEDIKKFYKHVVTYIIVNLFLTFVWKFSFKIFGSFILSNQFNSDGFKHIPFWLIWGIFLILDAFRTFDVITIFGKDWEERKMKEFMK
ncbi:2TM domain-containing protein [uncultured Polaribacter sp.]|uniref:2TM domain-containing protein n=1 Tax=uncultured Polaribacter sp. TaxID=174711 RepID=UPI0026206F29|nr:2TM domain-containing protein [uncultured Polaribacter sp.]